MRDSSLDEFLDPEAADDPSPDQTDETVRDDDPGTAAATEGPSAESDGSVEPAVPTADWSPAGAECAACGESVQRRWRDEAGMVCPDCKNW